MSTPFETAKSQGYSNEEILQHLNQDPNYSSKIELARQNGYGNDEIFEFIQSSSSGQNQPEQERSAYESYVERPFQIVASSATAGVKSLPRTAFDLLKTVISNLPSIPLLNIIWVLQALSIVSLTRSSASSKSLKECLSLRSTYT